MNTVSDIIFALVFGVTVWLLTEAHGVTLDKIKSGKEFVVGKASYQCTKTNELNTGEK
jgi:hypothetical protein